MRSPGPTFDIRAALADEVRAAIKALENSSGQAKGVHRSRLHLKRARALARVGRAGAPGLASVFNESARGVMGMLGRAREPTALADAARVASKKAHKQAARALDEIADTLAATAEAVPPLDVAPAHARLKDLLALAMVWPAASARQIARGAKRIARRARRARRRGEGAQDPARRHQWRKREKDRFYAALLLKRSWLGPRRRKTSAALGETLGAERDTRLLIERLAAGETPPMRALKALRRRRAKLARKADRLGRRLHAGGA